MYINNNWVTVDWFVYPFIVQEWFAVEQWKGGKEVGKRSVQATRAAVWISGEHWQPQTRKQKTEGRYAVSYKQ